MLFLKPIVLCFMALLLYTPAALFSQSKTLVKKSYAYYSITATPVQPKGGSNEIIAIHSEKKEGLQENDSLYAASKDTSVIIILETASRNVKWVSALQNKTRFTVTGVLHQGSVKPGFINGGKPVTINAAKGNYLFILQLYREKTTPPLDKKLLSSPVTIRVVYAEKTITIKTTALKELIVEPPA